MEHNIDALFIFKRPLYPLSVMIRVVLMFLFMLVFILLVGLCHFFTHSLSLSSASHQLHSLHLCSFVLSCTHSPITLPTVFSFPCCFKAFVRSSPLLSLVLLPVPCLYFSQSVSSCMHRENI